MLRTDRRTDGRIDKIRARFGVNPEPRNMYCAGFYNKRIHIENDIEFALFNFYSRLRVSQIDFNVKPKNLVGNGRFIFRCLVK